MSSVNKVILIGYVGQSAETRVFGNGGEVANFSLATSQSWKDKTTGEKKEKTEWHRIACYGALSDAATRFAQKGNLLCIEGSIETQEYKDKTTGENRRSTQIKCSSLTILSSSKTRGDALSSDDKDKNSERSSFVAQNQVGGSSFHEDDIPF